MPPCRRPMVTASARFSSAAFQASAVLQTVWLGALAPRPSGRGYRKVRLSGELCLSGECHSPDTGYLKGSTKRLLFAKSFVMAPFFVCMYLDANHNTFFVGIFSINHYLNH